jgi:hypothetical protein
MRSESVSEKTGERTFVVILDPGEEAFGRPLLRGARSIPSQVSRKSRWHGRCERRRGDGRRQSRISCL